MVRDSQASGFTVIEVVLFLAVTGLMMVGMLVGVSGSINRQRYEDAVYSFQDFIQGQYNVVDNTRNNRLSNYTCQAGTIAESGPGAEQSRGTSQDCTVVGRLLTSTDGRRFVSEPVYSANSNLDTTGSEAALLNSLQLITAPADAARDNDNYELAWNTTFYTDRAHPTSSNSVQLLIFRMPTSGVVRTYFRTTISEPINNFWSGSSPSEITLCVAPDGLIKSNPTGVRVLANAANANGVQFIPAGAGKC